MAVEAGTRPLAPLAKLGVGESWECCRLHSLLSELLLDTLNYSGAL